MKRTRLACRVFKRLHMNKENKISKETPIETVETIIEEYQIETISTLKREPKQVYSFKIKCKIQIQKWALEIIGLIDTGCSNTIIDKKLVPPNIINLFHFQPNLVLNKWMDSYSHILIN